MFELIESQERLNAELEEMRISLGIRDIKISHLKAKVQQLFIEGPSATDNLKEENEFECPGC